MFKFVIIIIFLDTVASLASYFIGQYVRLGGLPSNPDDAVFYIIQAVFYSIVVILSGYFCELYAPDRFIERSELAARVAVSIMVAFFFLAACYYAIPQMSQGRSVLAFSLLVFGVFQYLNHRTCQFFQTFRTFSAKIMILGTGPLAQVIERAIPLSRNNYSFLGFIQSDPSVPTISPNQIAGSVENIEEILSREKVDKLVVAIKERRGALPVKSLLTCKMRGLEIIDSPSFYEQLTGKLLLEDIQPSWFIYSSGFRVTSFGRIWKRLMDLVHAMFGLVLFSPVVPVVALLIKMSSPGPILYKQKRVGERGHEFTLLKFRTMQNDAEIETGPVWASIDDPRVTKLGGWLRKLRIDEIPQLINVLKGEMSFIGPRPERKEFVERLSEKIPYYGKRHFVRPGVTGWAQVKYPYGASDHDALEKLRYDLYYIKNCSMMLDLTIIMETIKVVLFGRGAR